MRRAISRVLAFLFCAMYAARAAMQIVFAHSPAAGILPFAAAALTGAVLTMFGEKSASFGCICLAAACAGTPTAVAAAFALALLFHAFAGRKYTRISAMLLGTAGLLGAEKAVSDLIKVWTYVELPGRIGGILRAGCAFAVFASLLLGTQYNKQSELQNEIQ